MIKREFLRILAKFTPPEFFATVRNYKHLSVDFGQFKTMRQWAAVDKDGNPIPWYAYPAIEYIKQLDFSGKNVFEYGSGNSTVFWSQRCKKLVSVENDREWYNKVKPRLPNDTEYLFFTGKDDYTQSIAGYSYDFDVVIIDGSYRYECAAQALSKLRADGLIILDNSDWWPKTSQALRKADLIEVDMSGFGPMNNYTWTTSFYFRRNVTLTPAYDRQPIHGVGSVPATED